jgi:methyl-accepting chemotaxis protein
MKSLFGRLNNLSFKLPLLLIASAFIAALGVGLNSHFQASELLVRQEMSAANSTSRYRADVLNRLGQDFASDISVLAENPTLRESFEFLQGVYDRDPTKIETLHKHYTERKPPTGGSRADYNGADDRSAYAIGHRRWHPSLNALAKEKKYYDLFFISTSGDVFYTVEKETDFATNLRTGPWRSTGLARAFEGALAKAAQGQAQFEDYEPYAPSNGDAAAFLARAIKSETGVVMGVVAVQIPDKAVATAITLPFGDGSGAVYIVGADGRLRTEVTSRGNHKVFAQTPHADLLKALGPKVSGDGKFSVTLDQQPAYVSVAAANFLGQPWNIVADVKSDTLYSGVNQLAVKNLLVGSGIVIAISILALFMARRITKPINQMRDAVGLLASGESSEILGVARKDELGELARSLLQVHDSGVTAARIKSALDSASVNVMVADPEGKIVYCNPAMLKFFQVNAQEFHKQFPEFSAEQMIGAAIDQFHRSGGWKKDNVSNTRVKIGELTIDLKVNQIRDTAGKSIGMITEWSDLTADLAAMSEVTQVVEAAIKGDFSGRIREDNKTGATRDLAAGQNRINTVVEAAIEEFGDTLRKVSDGDLVVRVGTDYQGRLAQLGNGINDTISRLAETVATIQRSAQDLNRAAGEINAGASDLAKRTEEEASSLEETAATTEQLAASVKQTADNSKTANELSDRARLLASDGGNVVHQAIHAMERIEDASKKIADIISVIDDIAFQTNLLALNAAVEAARAGDAGKGFAVVASEVRTLAQRSGQAARDIKELIIDSGSQVVEGVKLVHATGESLDKIVSASGEVAQMIAMIHSASAEQANGIEEMSTAVARIDEMTQQNSALAEQSAASAVELMKQLEHLNSLVATFRIDSVSMRRPSPLAQPQSEPDRLRQLAAEAFAQSRAPSYSPEPQQAPRPPQRVAAAGGKRPTQEWTEF